MSAEELSSDDQISPRQQEPRRKPDVARRVPQVAFGLGAAALAGVVAATGPVTSQSETTAATGAAAATSATSARPATATRPDAAINHLTPPIFTCTGSGN